MRLYLASSWKLAPLIRELADELRKEHEVDAFCDDRTGRFVFSFRDLPNVQEHDSITILREPRVQRAFLEDKKWLDWAEGVVLVVPSGKSAHLEAGYAKGCGKPVWIYGDFQRGDFDVMYGFADGLFRVPELNKLKKAIASYQ